MISSGGGVEPRWRRDGKELFSGTKLMAVDISTSPAFQAAVPRVMFEARVTANITGSTGTEHRWDVTLMDNAS